MSDAIEAMKERIIIAENVERELSGRKRDGITLDRIAGYTIVDDGQDKWICETETYTDAIEDIIGDILADKFNPLDDDGLDTESYNRLCGITGCLYSRIGIQADVENLCADLDCSAADFRRIMDSLGLENETLPAIMILLNEAGERFSGNSTYDMAQEWADAEFSPDACAEWIRAGFWNATTAAALRDAGLSANDASNASIALIDATGDDGRYTDNDPVYSCCNGDTDTAVLIAQHKLTESESTVESIGDGFYESGDGTVIYSPE